MGWKKCEKCGVGMTIPLKGDRAGQRAIYLNRKWRAVYVIEGGEVKIVKVIEVHPHEY